MTMGKRIDVLVLATMIITLRLELSAPFMSSGRYGFISTAEAIVGRPLTPVSVAGVARRTARRCAVGVYDC
jgi:hypothetical protein